MQKKIISLVLAIVLIFNLSASSVFALNYDEPRSYDEYSSAIYGDNWQSKYIITVIDNDTKKENTLTIPAINNGKIDKKEFETSLPKNYKLVKFVELKNPNYQVISVDFVDTLFDMGCFSMSVAEFATEPSFWKGFNVVLDGLAVAFPFIPSVTGVKKMIEASDKLADAMKWGVARYDDLRDAKKNIPEYSGYEAHHIIEKRFRPAFPEIPSGNSMFAVVIKKEDHALITKKMRNKIKYGTNYKELGRDRILEEVQEGYSELYKETNDELFNFLSKFVEESNQFHTLEHVDIKAPN